MKMFNDFLMESYVIGVASKLGSQFQSATNQTL